MADFVGKLLEPLKEMFPFIARHLLALFLFAALLGWFVNLLPQSVFEFLKIDQLRTTSRETIGVFTFIATFCFGYGVAYKLYTLALTKWNESRGTHQKKQLLHTLTPTEYRYLRKYIENKSQTETSTLFDGVVAGLIQKGILYKADSQPNRAGEQDFNMYPWVYSYLSAHLEILIPKDDKQSITTQERTRT